MSRNYEVTVKVKGIEEKVIEEYFKEHFDSSIDLYEEFSTGILEGTANIFLNWGHYELDTHEKMSEYFKSINPLALVQTQWVDLENLPFEEYGDEFLDYDD